MTKMPYITSHAEIDPRTMIFAIFGIIATICAILQFTRVYIKKHIICIPENSWYLHFFLLMAILNMFVLPCISYTLSINNYIISFFCQIPPAICVCCILTLTLNLLFINQYFSGIFLLILPILLVFQILIMFIPCSFITNIYTDDQSTTDGYQSTTYAYAYYTDNYDIVRDYAMASTYLYLDNLLTMSMILTLCLYKTLYGKLLCLATLTSWILWNINWSIFCPCLHLFLTSYVYLTLGYILLVFYIYPILLAKYLHALAVVLYQFTFETKFPPPPLS
nr:membrane G protein-coupled receptor 13A [Elephant endotheliotropic herpesvirus 1B]